MTNNSSPQPPEAPTANDAVEEHDEPGGGASFPVVGVGASAGGLEAFTQLLKALPADTGMVFVLVQHLAPAHPSALAEILSRATTMPVIEVKGEPTVEPNHVYVMPPDACMLLARGVLHLQPREGGGTHHPIDRFFRSLAREQRHQAVGVVLSGTATDGTTGLEEIKADGGITFAQDATAQHQGMPHSAIATGCVDFVLPPEGIAREIVRIAHHPYTAPKALTRETHDQPNFAHIVQLLHRGTGVDFTGYKFNTVYRRVTRRMIFQKIDGLTEYVRFLRENPAEQEALYQDILISVTSFFRDNESFEALKTSVFPGLLKDRSRHDLVRFWTPGCSTGQEAYSLAIAFAEAAESAGSSVPLQLFASDLNAASIEKARAGVYSKDIAQDVSPERLRRFFTEVDGHYRVAKSIRDACVFCRHNVLADPPFSRIDLISCRNLLIYLEPVLQQKLMPSLHYALRPNGRLWLGGSETIGGYRDLFDAEDPQHKIYSKKPGSSRDHRHFPEQHGGTPRAPFVPIAARPNEGAELHREADRLLSARFAPPGVLVSSDLDILQYRGDTGLYLAPSPGKASLNLLKMLREGLLVAVRAAVLRAGKEQAPAREEGLRVKSNGGYREVAIEVIPMKDGFLVLFEDSSPASRGHKPVVADAASQQRVDAPGSPDPDRARLEQELRATREYLQLVIEQQEAANEELQSANEEIQSANEELQSTNEELETSKEEIQSNNEELTTVNDESNNRNAELHRVNNDLVNLLGSVQMAIVMLGPDLRVRRFTPMAEKLLNLTPGVIGRPLADIRLNLDGLPDLEPLLTAVLATGSVNELEVRDKHDRWYSLRLCPYRTLENKIDGAVVLLVDVDAVKRAEQAMAYLGAIVASSDDAIVSKDLDSVITSWNNGAERLFGYAAEDVIYKPIALLIPADRVDEEPGILERIRRGETVDHYETVRERKDGSRVDISMTVSPIKEAAGRIVGTADIFRDITERKRTEEQLRRSAEMFSKLVDLSPYGIYLLDSDLRIQRVSAGAKPVFGNVRPLIGRDFREAVRIIWSEPFASELIDIFRHTLETGEPYLAPSLTERRHDVDVVESYEWQIHRVTLSDGHYGIVCYFFDATRLRQAEYALRESEAQFRTLADAVPALIWVHDLGGREYVNRAYRDFLDLPLERIQQMQWAKYLHPEDAEEHLAISLRAAKDRSAFEAQFRFRRADGEYRWMKSIGRPRITADGTYLGYVGCSVDITDIKRMEDELRRFSAKLSDSHRRTNEFLAILAHELRNPLAPIRNALQVLRMKDNNGQSIESASAMMERQVDQMVRLVDDLLDVSRISRGKIELRRERVELASVVHHAVEAARSFTESTGHELTVTLPPNPVYLNADPTRLAQVMGNLLHNAFKFTAEGGHVRLTAQREGELAVIRVRDTGIGIGADELPRIFDMFMQADTSLERSVSGLGIGLTLVKYLVNLHDGSVDVHSAGVGQGSEFVVSLPIMVETPSLPTPEPTLSESLPKKARRILVVDDNRDSATSLATLLKLAGHQTHTAYDGIEAVDAAAAFKPDVVLLDIGLPKLNGYEAARKIRQQPNGTDLVLVALTGWGQEKDRQKSRDAGFNTHMVKPVDLNALMQLLASLPADQ